jgi:hypothetical protein
MHLKYHIKLPPLKRGNTIHIIHKEMKTLDNTSMLQSIKSLHQFLKMKLYIL